MKVPAWQYPSLAAPRGLIGATARRAVYLAVAALFVACSENVTAPSASRTPTIPVSANPDVVVMERTTDIAAHDGVAAVHQTSRQTLTGQVRVVQQGQEQLSRAPTRAGAGFDVANLPRPPISLPARYETAMCSALPGWTRTKRAVAGIGSDVNMTGVGDAPASTLRVMQAGRTVATVERTWVRTSTSWQLERQVTTSADGRYRDVVTYRHLKETSRQAVNNELPVATCVTPSSAKFSSPATASRSYYAPRGNPLLSPPAGASSFLGAGCSDDFGGDPCFDYQMDVYEADAAVTVAATLMTFACKIGGRVPPALAACGAAVVAYGASVAVLAIKQAALNNCRREQAEKKDCGCGAGGGSGGPELLSIGTTPTNGSSSMSVSPGSASTVSAPETPPSYMLGDCTGVGGGGGAPGGSGGGGGGGGGSCGYKDWEISYDGGRTWEFWGTFWTCVN